MASNRLMDKDMGLVGSCEVTNKDRIEDYIVGDGGSVTPLELSRFRGHETSLDHDVRWRLYMVLQLQPSTISTPMTTRHMSHNYVITTHPRVLS